jgi:hypothetical protein
VEGVEHSAHARITETVTGPPVRPGEPQWVVAFLRAPDEPLPEGCPHECALLETDSGVRSYLSPSKARERARDLAPADTMLARTLLKAASVYEQVIGQEGLP